MMELILADTDSCYVAALTARLRTLRPELQISSCQDAASLHNLIASHKESPVPLLFLYNTAEFASLGHLATASVWPDQWQVCPLLSGSRSARTGLDDPDCLYRLDPASRLLAGLESRLHTAAATAESADAAPVPVVAVGENRDTRLWLTLSFAASGYPGQLGQTRLRQLIRQGRQVVYLPLMPTYLMNSLAEPGSGLCLSDLLLHLVGGSVTADELGQYWQPHPAGYLQFRPPDRSDDLILCSPDILRQLVRLLKERLDKPGCDPMTALVDCAGLALSTVASLAVLCDGCVIGLPAGQDYAATAARREAGQLLAILPAGCQICEQELPAVPAAMSAHAGALRPGGGS
jgi:hypothetical protein